MSVLLLPPRVASVKALQNGNPRYKPIFYLNRLGENRCMVPAGEERIANGKY